MPDIRLILDSQELRAAASVFRQAMFGLPGGVTPVEHWVEKYIVPGRVYGAWLDGTLAGTTNSFLSELTLPGGESVAHAAVTHVGVLPHFTRRGVLQKLFRQQLEDLHQEGISVATLRASQGAIYPRFGYGVASVFQNLRIDKRELTTLPKLEGEVQLLPAADAWQTVQEIVARYPLSHAGTLTRWPQWWAMQQHRLEHSNLNHYVVLALKEGIPQAFVRYHAQPDDNWLYSTERTLVVDDFHAADPELAVTLFNYLLQLDIARFVQLPHRPVDDVLPLMLDNPRAIAQQGLWDETWLRIISLERTLNTRRYQDAPPVIVTVTDALLPVNQGNWLISSESVKRTTQPADLSLDSATLAMLLLGGHKVWQLIQARRIQIINPQAPKRLERLLACDEAPWSGIFF